MLRDWDPKLLGDPKMQERVSEVWNDVGSNEVIVVNQSLKKQKMGKYYDLSPLMKMGTNGSG